MVAEVMANLFHYQTFLALLIGVVGGLIIGVLPGLNATMAIALLLPFTFGMMPAAGMIMLTAVFASAVYGGGVLAILVCTPGTPGNAATAIDGYALTKQGRGLEAIGVLTIASTIGGVVSALFLLFAAPPLALVSLRFNAPEYFLIAIFGLTIIGSLAGKNMLKGLIVGAIGMAIAFIGFDTVFGTPRFTYQNIHLESGIQLVPALVGLFSMSQVLIMSENVEAIRRGDKIELPNVSGKFLPTIKDFIIALPNLMRSIGVGILVGILPGPGGDIGSWLAYNESRRWSKNKDLFGKGSMEAIWATESANNATASGSLVPTMALGIPGSAAAAVLLGGFMLNGLIPGHQLFTVQGGITYAILLGFLFSKLLMGVIGIFICRRLAKLANAPLGILVPVIVVLSVVGAYAINLSFFDAGVMIVFGFIGYFLRKTGFPTAPVVLALILTPMAEQGFHRAIIMSTDTPILIYYLSRPICVVLIFLIILSLCSPFILKKMEKRVAGKSS